MPPPPGAAAPVCTPALLQRPRLKPPASIAANIGRWPRAISTKLSAAPWHRLSPSPVASPVASDPKPEAALGNWKLPSGNTSRGEGSAPCDSVPGSADKDEPEACWASPPPPNFWLKDTLRLISLLQECLGHPEAHTGKGCGVGPRVCQGCVPRRDLKGDLKGDWAGIGPELGRDWVGRSPGCAHPHACACQDLQPRSPNHAVPKNSGEI
mmetsp:Transcript_52307/g.119308  ORF Transcript_52307/g.119308 Transcript_52307/m.119308 type:complete len:210 (+) Transcript_52307:1755-2384(+)